MNKRTTLGIDLAKSVFQVATLDHHHRLVSNRAYSRPQLRRFLAKCPSALVGLEACSSSHYWARELTQMGHTVKLLPAHFVKGFVYGNKHDANDARAIALAAIQPESPTVCLKSDDQLALQALLRVRERQVNNRTQCANQIRGLLAEHGVSLPRGHHAVRRFPIQKVPDVIQPLIRSLLEEFKQIDQLAQATHRTVQKTVQAHPVGQALLALPGFGPLNALVSLVVNPADFRNGRHYAAYLGLVPRQEGTGGKTRIQGLSKRGNCYHRKLLCDGARAFLNCNKDHKHPLWLWAKRIQRTRGHNIAVAALANKLARISWHVLKGEPFDLKKAVGSS